MWYKLYYLASEYLWFLGLVFLMLVGSFGMRQRQHQHRKGQKKWKDAVDNQMHEPLSLHPEIDSNLCGGCAACVTACPEGNIIQLINHKAVLVEPTKCVGHGECEASCPFKAIKLV